MIIPILSLLGAMVADQAEVEEIKRSDGRFDVFGDMLTKDPVMGQVFTLLRRVSSTDVPVLLLGESGTGKDLAAHGIHDNSLRKDRAFVAINCGGIPETLIDSELFGHVKGAFTGADRAREGAFQAANGGTLFLDELGDLPLDSQARLLRALDSGEVRPVGSPRTSHVDVRIVAATNKNLLDLVRRGRFRSDLYYRLSVMPVELPPLRDRPADVGLLTSKILRTIDPRTTIDERSMKSLLSYSWPGNIRELKGVLQRAVILSGTHIHHHAILFAGPHGVMPAAVMTTPEMNIERRRLILLMLMHKGRVSEVARAMGVSRSTAYYQMKKHDVPTGAEWTKRAYEFEGFLRDESMHEEVRQIELSGRSGGGG